LRIPLYRVFTDPEDLRQVASVLSRGEDWAIGPEVAEFERLLASSVGRKYAVAFNSGTSALHAAMLSLRVSAGDKVVVPSFTFIATANSALFVGATPVFADIEPLTCGLDPAAVERVLTEKTKVMVPVHVGGIICKGAEELESLAQERKLVLIEDAYEALGSTARGRMAGSYGDASVFSFAPNKLISTGEGGMVLTDDRKTLERLSLVKSHGRLDREPYFATSNPPDYVSLGYNWRLSSMAAALGISQFGRLGKAIALRRGVASLLSSGLGRVRGVETPQEPKGFKHTYQMYTIRVKAGRKARDGLRDFLKEEGVVSKVYFDPIHQSRFYRGRAESKSARLPMTEKVSEGALTLPMYPTMKKGEIEFLLGRVKEWFSSNS